MLSSLRCVRELRANEECQLILDCECAAHIANVIFASIDAMNCMEWASWPDNLGDEPWLY